MSLKGSEYFCDFLKLIFEKGQKFLQDNFMHNSSSQNRAYYNDFCKLQ